jgi:inner membrane protein
MTTAPPPPPPPPPPPARALRFPLLGKALALAAVLLALVAALAAVRDVVAEREGRLREAERSVAQSLAAAQRVAGPVLRLACVETWERPVERGAAGRGRGAGVERIAADALLAPATLAIDGTVAMEPRHRGIFAVDGYALRATLVATFPDAGALAPPAPRQPGGRVACEGAPVLAVELADPRGIRAASVRLDGESVPVRPGADGRRGFSVPLPAAAGGGPRALRAEIALELIGTGELALAPVGDETRATLASAWPHPSFGGRFLPVERTVGADGFRATWRTNALATTAPRTAGLLEACTLAAAAAADPARPCTETFGVAFADPVDTYALADRATKYGLLFVALTFAGVGAAELLRGVRVHPVQYGLVGAALAVFFLLLVSLAEHVAFGVAYAIAASACTLLLGFYGASVLGGPRPGLAFGGAVAALYGVLFVLLQLEQTALLLGSVLVFATIAGAMVATRKLDWYAVAGRLRGVAPAA